MFLSKFFWISHFFLRSVSFHLCQLLEVPSALGHPSSSFFALFFSNSLPFFSSPYGRTTPSFCPYLQVKLLPLFSHSWEFFVLLASIAWCCNVPELVEGIITNRIPYNPCILRRTFLCSTKPWRSLGSFFLFYFIFPQGLMDVIKLNLTLFEVKGGNALKLSRWAPLSAASNQLPWKFHKCWNFSAAENEILFNISEGFFSLFFCDMDEMNLA